MRITIIILASVFLLMGISGVANAQWIESGVPICTNWSSQLYHDMAADSMGGALFSWRDYRHGDINTDIYVQRIDGDGNVLWDISGVPVCEAPGNQLYAKIEPDGKGGGIVVWQDQRNGDYDIYMQRINSDGTVLWAEDGLPLCETVGDQARPALVSNSDGGAIIVWTDYRDGYLDYYAQKIDSNGVKMWVPDGARFCSSGSTYFTVNLDASLPKADCLGGIIVMWADTRDDIYYMFAQRISSNGDILWTENGVRLSSNDTIWDEGTMNFTPDGFGGGVFVWRVEAGMAGTKHDIYAQRIRSDGSIAWDSSGIEICISPDWWCASVTPTWINEDNIIITWMDVRESIGHIYAQKVDSTGTSYWDVNGMAVCDDPGGQYYPKVVRDDADGVIVTWLDSRTMTGNDIFSQRLSSSGLLLWADGGVNVYHTDDPSDQGGVRMVPDGQGGGLVSWRETRSGYPKWIYSKKITNVGDVPVPTFIQEYYADTCEERILIQWTISELIGDGVFIIERKDGMASQYLRLNQIPGIYGDLSYSYSDNTCRSGSEYSYRVSLQEGSETKVLFETQVLCLPLSKITLYQNYPNPFNPSTAIEYYLPRNSFVKLDIYDIRGRHIAELVNGITMSGKKSVLWNGRDSNNNNVTSGVYFYKLRADKETISKKMLLIR